MKSSDSRVVLLIAALATVALPAHQVHAQEWDVVRRSFTFIDNELTIDVTAPGAGELHLARGSFGTLEVAARAPGGIAGMGLGGFERNRLALAATGVERVEYLVIVPEEVRVRVRLPGHRGTEVLGSSRAGARFAWQAAPDAVPVRAGGVSRVTDRAGAAAELLAPFVIHAAPVAPSVVSMENLEGIRALSVRIEGSVFRVEADRPLPVPGHEGETLRLGVPAGEKADVVLWVPRRAPFTLRLAGMDVLRLENGEARSLCTPVTRQVLDGTRHWFTFGPLEDGVRCG